MQDHPLWILESHFMQNVTTQVQHPLWRRLARAILPGDLRHSLGCWLHDLRVGHFPDRLFMKNVLIPAIGRQGGQVLYVGCRRYTRRYPALLGANGATCSTIDIDPAVAPWGAPQRHVTTSLQDAPNHWPRASFDTLVLSGVFGYGLNTAEDQNEALRACHFLLKPNGWLILGWNSDKSPDPKELSNLKKYFVSASFQSVPVRQAFTDSTHVYDSLRAVTTQAE